MGLAIVHRRRHRPVGGIDQARQLARDEADKALASLAVLPPSRAKRSLELMVDYVLDRIY